MDGIKEAHMEARISELENELKMAREETDQLKIKIHETFKDTPVGDRIYGEAVMNPEEQCHSIEEYLTKANIYMIQEGEEKDEVWEELEKTKEEMEELEERLEATALERDGALDDLEELKEKCEKVNE